MSDLVLLHGALGSLAQMAPLKSLFDGRNVVLIDFPGHGIRVDELEGFSIEAFSKDLAKILDQNSEPIDLFGYSMGGYVALNLAKEKPEKFNSIATLGTKFQWDPEAASKEVKMLNPEKIGEKVPALAKQLADRHGENHWEEVVLKTAEMLEQMGHNPPLDDKGFKNIKVPVRLMLGDQDEMVSREETNKVDQLLPNSEFFLLENTPHPFEKVDHSNVAGLVKEFCHLHQ